MTDYNKILEDLKIWIKERMDEIGATKAVIGISGGKDSSVTAALMTNILGSENVIGVLMPDGVQPDIDYSHGISDFLGIETKLVDISGVTKEFNKIFNEALNNDILKQTTLNLPPRVRMTTLYGISQSIKGSIVINTSNMSEDWVGYATVYGDTTGAFSPLGMLTTEEVIEIGRILKVPEKYLVKPPSDGLTGKTDEDVLGVKYPEINKYIREGKVSEESKTIIDRLHRISRFKFLPIPMFNPGLPIIAEDIANIYK